MLYEVVICNSEDVYWLGKRRFLPKKSYYDRRMAIGGEAMGLAHSPNIVTREEAFSEKFYCVRYRTPFKLKLSFKAGEVTAIPNLRPPVLGE